MVEKWHNFSQKDWTVDMGDLPSKLSCGNMGIQGWAEQNVHSLYT